MREGAWRRWAEPPAPAGWLAGAVAAAALTVVMVAGRISLATPLIPELLAEAFFAVVPMGLFRIGIRVFGDFAKTLAFAAAFGAQLAGLSLAGAWYARRRAAPEPERPAAAGPSPRWVAAAGLGIRVWLFTGLLVLPLAGAGWFGARVRSLPGFPAAFSSLLFFVGFGLLVEALLPWAKRVVAGRTPAGAPTDVTSGAPPPPPAALSRRRFLRRLGLGAAGLLGLVGLARGVQGLMHLALGSEASAGVPGSGGSVAPAPPGEAPGDGAADFKVRGLSPEVTSNADFYVVSKNLQDPQVDEAAWRLRVEGLVGRPLVFDRRSLRNFTLVGQYQTLECISNPVGGDLISNAYWRGVRLSDLLEAAGGVRPGAVDVALHAEDGYSDSIPLEKALAPGTIVALEMNGVPLPPEHGFPARLLVPGIYGIKNVKWLSRVEVVDHDYRGYWQVRGWSDEGVIKPMSRIDVPRHRAKVALDGAALAGIAFAGTRGITAVEISPDGGTTWLEARVKKALGPYTWQLWVAEWKPPATGTYVVQVRATDGTGEVQTAEARPSLPEGATGHHTINLRVTG